MAVGTAFFLFFDTAFTIFHQLFFAEGTWTFDPASDRLVQLFPYQFWTETSVAIAVVVLLLTIAVWLVAHRLARSGRSAGAEPRLRHRAAPRRHRWTDDMSPRLRRLAGRLLAPALWAAGLVLIVLGNALAGFALVMAGWFARVAARASRRRDELERLIDGVTVGEVMETEAFVVAPQATLDTFADSLDVQGATTVARVMRDDRLLGVVGLRELARVPRGRWPTVHAAEAMSGADALPLLAPEDALRPAADRLGASSASGFPVVDEGRIAGILTRLAVGRVLHERSLRAAEDAAAPGKPGGPDARDDR